MFYIQWNYTSKRMHFKKSEFSQNYLNFVDCPVVDCPILIVSIECAVEVWCLMTSGWSLIFNDVSKYLPFFIVKLKQEATWKLGYLGYSSDTFRRFISLVFSYWRRFIGYWLWVIEDSLGKIQPTRQFSSIFFWNTSSDSWSTDFYL